MRNFTKQIVLLALGIMLAPLETRAALFTFTATDEGWYSGGGVNYTWWNNYAVGRQNAADPFLRNFFVFDLGNAPTGTIVSASLRLYNPKAGEAPANGFVSPYPSETFHVGSVATPLETLTTGLGGTNAFNDLGGGTLWGTRTVDASDNGTYVIIILNSDFISTATASLGNGSLAIGGWLEGDTDFYERKLVFAWTSETVTQKPPQLVLDIGIVALPVQLVNPNRVSNYFQFSFASQAGLTNTIQYRTNLVSGANWQNYSNAMGDGTVKTIQVPVSVFSPAQQGFLRVITQ